MKTYKVTYVESLVHTFYVDAESEKDAVDEFYRKSANGELDFSAGGVYDTNVNSVEEVK